MSKVKRKAPRKKTTRIYHGTGAKDYWIVPYADARSRIELHRTEGEVRRGKPGISIDCMNAHCIRNHRRSFPHPVFMAAVTKTAAYIVDKMQGRIPVHAIRYGHNDRYGVGVHDEKGGREYLLKFGKAEFTLKLSPPRERRPTGARTWTKGNGSHKRPTIPAGAFGRAIAAGLIRKAA